MRKTRKAMIGNADYLSITAPTRTVSGVKPIGSTANGSTALCLDWRALWLGPLENKKSPMKIGQLAEGTGVLIETDPLLSVHEQLVPRNVTET